MFTHRLHTLKDKPSRVNKRTKILSRFDVKIHQMKKKNYTMKKQHNLYRKKCKKMCLNT